MHQCNVTGYRFYDPAQMAGDGAFYASLQQKLGDHYYHDWKFENQLAYDAMNPGDKVTITYTAAPLASNFVPVV